MSVLAQTWRPVTITENMCAFMKGRLDTVLGQKFELQRQLQQTTTNSMTQHGSVPTAIEDFFETYYFQTLIQNF